MRIYSGYPVPKNRLQLRRQTGAMLMVEGPMILKVYVDEQTYPIDVPRYVIDDASDFFAMIDRDLDNGHQMSREWVQELTVIHRCQVAADRLLTALHTQNEKSGVMMAGYILAKMPGVIGVRMDTQGDMLEHELIMGP